MKTIVLLVAITTFLASFWTKDDELAKSMARGKEVYNNNCIVCHMGKGEGVDKLNPPLANSDYLMKTPEKAMRAIKFGLQKPIEVNGITYKNIMPEPGLGDDEVADVMNYIMNSWGNKSTNLITTPMVEGLKP